MLRSPSLFPGPWYSWRLLFFCLTKTIDLYVSVTTWESSMRPQVEAPLSSGPESAGQWRGCRGQHRDRSRVRPPQGGGGGQRVGYDWGTGYDWDERHKVTLNSVVRPLYVVVGHCVLGAWAFKRVWMRLWILGMCGHAAGWGRLQTGWRLVGNLWGQVAQNGSSVSEGRRG